jgi:hypothetical protein
MSLQRIRSRKGCAAGAYKGLTFGVWTGFAGTAMASQIFFVPKATIARNASESLGMFKDVISTFVQWESSKGG